MMAFHYLRGGSKWLMEIEANLLPYNLTVHGIESGVLHTANI
jgi:hypothetical protein